MIFSGVVNKSSDSYIIFPLTFHKYAHKKILCPKMIKKFIHWKKDTTKKKKIVLDEWEFDDHR